MKQPHVAALYMRLSRDDERFGDSVSIETQRILLRQYAENNHIVVYDEYVDDGWSGTNFDRPSFQRMIADIEAKKINCVITKDLSRFGREHISMGYYLEVYFVEKNVRYIAVTEGEDTIHGLSDFVPFKNLFNEWYAKDASRKVKAAFRSKFVAGQRISKCPKFGYIKDPNDKHHLIPDPETRWIPELMFSLALQGWGPIKIKKYFLDHKVPRPGYIAYLRYGQFANVYKNAPEESHYTWTLAQIKEMLKDETYIGNTVHYRTKKLSYKAKKYVHTDPEEWFRIEGTHEPLINPQDFAVVQDLIKSRRREPKAGEINLFCGFLKCADCGCSLTMGKQRKKNGRVYTYYTCNRYREGLKACTGHIVPYQVLYDFVLERLQYWIELANCDDDEFSKAIMQHRSSTAAKVLAVDIERLSALKRRAEELNCMFAALYEDRIAGKITEQNFEMLRTKIQKEQAAIAEQLPILQERTDNAEQTLLSDEHWKAILKQYTAPTELTVPLLAALISTIIVHEPEKTPDGRRRHRIDIEYRFTKPNG